VRWIIICLFLCGCDGLDMYSELYRQANRVRTPKRQVVSWGPFTGGLVTAREAERCNRTECPDLQNMVIETERLVRTRDGLSAVCSGVDGTVLAVKDVTVNGTDYTIIGGDDGGLVSHSGTLYKKDGTSVEAFQNDAYLAGPPRFAAFNDMLMIFDSGMLKYWDGKPWATGATYEVVLGAYDAGIGADAYLADYRSPGYAGIRQPEAHIGSALGSGGGKSGVAVGVSIPEIETTTISIGLPTVTVSLGRWGNGYAGTETPVTIKLINIQSAVEVDIAEADLVDPSDLPQITTAGGTDPTEYQEYTYTFTTADLSYTPGMPERMGMTYLNPNYLVAVEFAGGDASNYVYVQTYTIDYYGVSGNKYTWGGSSYGTTDPYSRAVMSVRRNRAPDAIDGIVHANRLFVIEGPDGTHPDRLWYSGAGNPFDWSSPNSGGYIDTGKPIGGIASFYGDVWVFGTTRDPSLRRLTGDTPAEYALEDTMQEIAGHYKSIVTTPADVYFLHPAGMDSVRVMQEFGDVRAISQTMAIKDVVTSNYDTTAFAGYDPHSGLVLLKLNDSTDDIYAIHTRIKLSRTIGDIVYQVSPIAKWVLNLPQISGNDQSPTAFGSGEGFAYIGTDQGAVYKIDNSVVTDAGNAVSYSLKTAYMSTRFGEMNARRANFDAFGDDGGSLRIIFYTNHSRTALFYQDIDLPTSLVSSDPDDPSGGDDFMLNFDRFNVNFPFRALMMEYSNITLNGNNPIYFGGISVQGFNKGSL